jgi:hypothetical protein
MESHRARQDPSHRRRHGEVPLQLVPDRRLRHRRAARLGDRRGARQEGRRDQRPLGARARPARTQRRIEKLGDARAAFELYYQRRALANGASRASWADDNVYKCFEAIGKGDFCSAESYGTMHPSNAANNPLPEAKLCAGYGHLRHLAIGTSCHGPLIVPPGTSKCIDRCTHNFDACVLRTSNPGACGDTKNSCTTVCFAKK